MLTQRGRGKGNESREKEGTEERGGEERGRGGKAKGRNAEGEWKGCVMAFGGMDAPAYNHATYVIIIYVIPYQMHFKNPCIRHSYVHCFLDIQSIRPFWEGVATLLTVL